MGAAFVGAPQGQGRVRIRDLFRFAEWDPLGRNRSLILTLGTRLSVVGAAFDSRRTLESNAAPTTARRT
jgi:hypothetical protein